MTGSDELDRVVIKIYELGLNAETWPQMLDEIAAFYGCSKIGYMHIAHDDTQRVMQHFRHPEPDSPSLIDSLQTYQELPPGSDIWWTLAQEPRLRNRNVFLCNELLSAETVLKSDHFNLVVRPAGCFDNLGMKFDGAADFTWYLSVYSDGPEHMFTQRDFALHRALFPHLKRVVDVQNKFNHAMRMAALRGTALDTLAYPIVIADARAKMVFANEAAQTLLETGSGMVERYGRVCASDGNDDIAFRSALERACGIGTRPVGAGVSLRRAPPAGPLGAQILPFDPAVSDDPFQRFAFDRLALVVFADPDDKRPGGSELLAKMYGLRPSEVRVAELLVEGLAQKEIAEALELSEGTVRWHVKNLYAKFDVRRESQLVMKLAAVVLPVTGG